MCGSLLSQGLHLSTITLGDRLANLQRLAMEEMTELLFGYDPEPSGFFAEAVHLTDIPNRQVPGVSFLQMPANQAMLRRWQSHFLASGVLDSPSCPVRPAVKTSAAGAGACAADDHPALEVDPSAPPVITDAAGLAAWRKKLDRLRARLWAI
eukprot:contig_21631_g5344